MYIITGAYGFIGSNMVAYLNSLGIDDIIIIDDYVDLKSKSNLNDNQFKNKHNISLDKKTILPDTEIDAVFHFGAISDTLEKDNLKYINDILKWKSISLCFPKYNIYSSPISRGSIRIALDVACAIKKKKFWCTKKNSFFS